MLMRFLCVNISSVMTQQWALITLALYSKMTNLVTIETHCSCQ